MDNDIQEMKCFAFRIAQKRWELPPVRCAELFEKCGAYAYIQECYDILHLSSYECVVNDLEKMMQNAGVAIC